MKKLNAVAALLLLAVVQPTSGATRRAAAVAPPAHALSIEFIERGSGDASMTAAGSEAWLDLNVVSHNGNMRERVTRMRKRFGIRVTRAGGTAWGTATISARLDSTDGRATIRVDGRLLTSASAVIDARVSVGELRFHTVEIEVPVTAAEGPLAASITWEAISE